MFEASTLTRSNAAEDVEIFLSISGNGDVLSDHRCYSNHPRICSVYVPLEFDFFRSRERHTDALVNDEMEERREDQWGDGLATSGQSLPPSVFS